MLNVHLIERKNTETLQAGWVFQNKLVLLVSFECRLQSYVFGVKFSDKNYNN